MSKHNAGPRGPWTAWMAWNRPGNTGGNAGGGLFGRLGGRLPDLGGFNPLHWMILVVALWLVFSSVVLITEQQRGIVLRFGQLSRVLQPGLNFKLPWPVEHVIKINATEIKNYSDRVPVLTRDENIVNVAMNVQYRVGDPRMYLFGSRDPDRMLEQVAQSVVREQVGRSDLDTVLGARGPLSVSASHQLQASLDAYRTGLVVTELNLQDARPPEEVKPAFDEVNSAQQIKDQLINEARAYAAKVVPEARGEAARRRTEAEGYKVAKIARAEGDATRFGLLRDEYRNAPEVTRKRLWLETLQDVLGRNRKVIGADSRQLIYVPMPGAAAGVNPAVPPAIGAEALLPPVEATPEPQRSGREPQRGGRQEPTR